VGVPKCLVGVRGNEPLAAAGRLGLFALYHSLREDQGIVLSARSAATFGQ
jgi:hypothetical protein